MKIFAFAGSNSSTSINRKLVAFALEKFPDSEIHFIDLNDYEMPLFSVDREKSGHPKEAHQFLENIAKSDAIICSLAEHNRSYSTAFKNILDWTSRINPKLFQNKPMLLMSTSPGNYGGGNVMAEATKFFPGFGADIKETFSLPKFNDHFVDEKGIIQSEYSEELNEKINNFKQEISK